MGLHMRRMMGTGRATCKICDKPILPGQLAIKVTGFRTEGSCHASVQDCPVEDKP